MRCCRCFIPRWHLPVISLSLLRLTDGFLFCPVCAVIIGFNDRIPICCKVTSVTGSTDAKPIIATQREYRFDRDALLLGAYCLRVDEHFEETREWFKEAGLQFPVAVSGNALNEEDLDWFLENGMGIIIAPRSDYYLNMRHEAIWGVDLRDEPSAAEFPALQEQVQALYAQDQNHFPLINLFPMYAGTQQLGEECDVPLARDHFRIDPFNGNSIRYRMHLSDYIGTIDSDLISADIYALYIDNETGKLSTYGHWLRNLDILAEACRASGRDLWVITQAAGNAKEEGGGMRHCDDPKDQRWQNYVSLAFGAKAIIYGCYYTGWWDQSSHMIDNSGKRTATYYAVQQVNREDRDRRQHAHADARKPRGRICHSGMDAGSGLLRSFRADLFFR